MEDLPLEKRGGLKNSTRGIDIAADTCIGCSNKRPPVFNRSEDRHGKMLLRGTGAAKPGIIGDVQQQVGLIADE